MISADPWVWLSAFLTLCSFTLLYGDNPFFRLGEYVYVCIAVSHSVLSGISAMQYRFGPLATGGAPATLYVTLILGLMSLFVVWRKYAWIASFPISILIGVGTGLTMRSVVATDLIGNLRTVITEAGQILVGSPSDQLGYFVRVIFTLSGMIYLLFTVLLKGPVSKPIGYIRTFGKYVFLTYLGLKVGNDIIMFEGLVTSSIVRLATTWLGLGG